MDDDIVRIIDNVLENKCITSTQDINIFCNFSLLQIILFGLNEIFKTHRQIIKWDEIRHVPPTLANINENNPQLFLEYQEKIQ